MVRVALADDSLLVREGVLRLLESEPEITVIAECGDGDTLLEAVAELHPDVVLTDIRMPPSREDEGIEIARRLRASDPDIGVIVLSQYADPGFLTALLADGSAGRGYLLKESLTGREQLVSGILAVAEGGSVIDAKVVDRLIGARMAGVESPLSALSPRELETLAEVASGKSNQAIADKLVITKRAVERHIGSIFAKLDLGDETEVSRRVAATLIFLAGQEAPAPPPVS